MEHDIVISAVIPTHNNATQLRDAIETLLAQTFSPQRYEIVIVDNGSMDGTPNTVRTLAQDRTQPRIVYMQEPRLGLSLARNAGAEAAAGRWVAYMDDDALAAPDWLETIVETYSTYPDAVAVGGRVVGEWEGPLPPWFDSHFGIAVSVLEWGPDIKPLRFPEWMCGANYSVERELILRLGGHDPELGRRGKLQFGAEEVELQLRIEKAALLVVYNPRVVVRHRIPRQRLTKQYYLERQYWGGRTQYLVDRKHRTQQYRCRQGLYLLARTPRSLFLALLHALRRDERLSLMRLGQEWFAFGYIRQMLSGQ
jgi:glycosyltransferase involved in cell wall biosynthesis